MMTEMVEANLNGLDKLIIPKHRADRPDWYTKEGWEKKRHKSMKKNIGKSDVVYYVGAEEGEFPALCAKWGAEVVLFEPNPRVWGNIKAIWEANELDTPITFQGFASNDNRIVDIKGVLQHGFPPCADDEIIAAHGFKELYIESQNYNQIKLDKVSEVHVPTVITMDVEGSEFEVLKGAEQTILKYKPKIWLSLHPEFLFDQWGVYSREVRNWLTDRGYKETLLEYKHEVHLLYE